MKKKIFTMLFLFSAVSIYAQELDNTADTIISPQYFIAIIAGVLLAMGFQFILTALSVAAGITAIGDVREKYVHSKNHPNNKDHFDDDENDNDDDGMSAGTMVTTGFGLWSIITVGLSLFGATALALKLTLITSTTISIALGLVIWATFFILLFYLESKMVNSLIGSLINTATAGLRASGEAVKQVFSTSKDMLSTSEEKKMMNVADKTVDKIRKDFDAIYDPEKFDEAIEKFFKNVNKSIDKAGKEVDEHVPDYKQIKKDIEDIVEKSAKENAKQQDKHNLGGSSGGSGKWMAAQQVINNAISQSSEQGGDKSKIEKLKQVSKELKEAYASGDTSEEKFEKVVAKLTPAEEDQVKNYLHKIEDFIAKATPGDMEPEQLQKKIWALLDNPSEAKAKIMHKVSDMDRDTIVSLLAKNTALEKDQINKYADKLFELFQKLKKQFSGSNSSSTADSANSMGATPKEDIGEMKKQIEIAIFKFMNHTGHSNLNFSMLKNYFMGTMDDSKDSLKNVKNRLKNMDKDSVVEMVKNNTMIDQSHINKVTDTFEDAKQTVLDKIQKIEDEANRKIENTKRKAVIQAENTRKNVAAAAWWLVASAVLSAGAAIAGSLVAIS